MAALLALAPIALLLVLMVGGRWSAAAAGAAGAAVAAPIAMLGFGYGSELGPLPSLLGPMIEAAFLAATIVWIIFPALCIHEYQTQTGATALVGRWLASLTDDRRITALLVAWFFGLFLEGAAGFGTPVALAAPLLVAIGFTPVKALTLALLGSAAGVSFGAIGTPVAALLTAGPLDPNRLALLIVLLHAATGWTMAALVYRLAGRHQDPQGSAAAWRWAGSAAAFFFVPAALLAWSSGPELPTLGGALVGGALFVALVKRHRPPGAADRADAPAGRALLNAALPYLAVVALILATRTITPVADWLRGFGVEWQLFGRFEGAVAPLHHPGTMLFLGFLAAGLMRRQGRGALPEAARRAAARLPRVALALVTVLLLARLMVHSGMIDLLATSAAGTLGGIWPLLAPAIGALGAFVTGSATASNLLFGQFQYAAATNAGLSPTLMTAAQGFGAAVGNLVAPFNIVAGGATVGLIGREGEVLRRTLPPALLYAGAGGALVLLLSYAIF